MILEEKWTQFSDSALMRHCPPWRTDMDNFVCKKYIPLLSEKHSWLEMWCEITCVWSNWAVKCIMFCPLKVHLHHDLRAFPSGLTGERQRASYQYGSHRGIPPPYWLSGNQCVGWHLRLGCLLASYSDQVLMSLRLGELVPGFQLRGLPWCLGNF